MLVSIVQLHHECKNPDIFDCSFNIVSQILILFGTDIPKYQSFSASTMASTVCNIWFSHIF